MKSPKYSGKPKKLKPIVIRRVVGLSMTPTLRPERLVLATSLFGPLLPEQVVIFHHKRMELIKRIQKVENGRIFVVGDNKRASIDSRSFGWLPIENVIARVIWPRLS